MVGNGWEMVGVYPTYVLRSGAFLAGAFFLQKSATFPKKCLFGCFYDKTFFFIIKRLLFLHEILKNVSSRLHFHENRESYKKHETSEKSLEQNR